MTVNPLKRYLSPPVVADDSNLDFAAKTVHVVAWLMLVLAALTLIFYYVIVRSRQTVTLFLLALGVIQAISSLWLAHHHRVRGAALLLVGSFSLDVTMLIIIQGTIQSLSTFGYAISIMFATLLLGNRAGLLTTFTALLLSLIVTVAEQSGILTANSPPDPPIANWFNLALYIGLISAGLFLYRANLSRVLATSMHNEHILAQRNRELEQEITDRNMTEIMLERQAELLGETERIAKIGSWVWDITENRVVWSAQVYRLHGLDPSAYVPSYAGFLEIVHPDDRPQIEAAIGQTLAIGKPYSIEFRQQHPDGTTHVFLAEGKLERDATGEPVRLRGFLHDITERKQTEMAVRASEERFRSLFESSPISLWEEDFSGVKAYLDQLPAKGPQDLVRYLYEHPEVVTSAINEMKIINVNSATAALYGTQDLTKLVESLRVTFREGQTQGFRQELSAYLLGQMPYRAEQKIITPNGREVDTLVTSAVVAGYEQTWARVLVSVMDISARKLAEQALVKQVERTLTMSEIVASLAHLERPSFETSIHQALEAVAIFANAERGGIYLLEATCEAATLAHQWYAYPNQVPAPSGQASTTSLNRLPPLLQFPGDSELLQCLRRDMVIDSGATIQGENAMIPSLARISEQAGAVSAAIIPLVIDEQLLGWVSFDTVRTPITWSEEAMQLFAFTGQIIASTIDRKRSSEALRKLNADLERRIAQRTEQLQAANSELESFAYSVSHDLRAPLRSIDGFSQALLEDYQAVLDDTGKGYLRRVRSATQRMDRLISDLLQLSRVTRQEIKAQDVDLSAIVRTVAAELRDSTPTRRVEFVIAPKLMAVCDPGLLKVALENVVGNAWKFTSKHEQARIEFGAIRQQGKMVYFVRDDGAGFDQTYADKLFGPFQRLHRPDEFEGTGIGLATVQRIIRRHGGRIWAEGVVEQGATFYFSL
jgi:PAS domain S-box-containing protein